MSAPKKNIKPIIINLEGTELTAAEQKLFEKEAHPFGVILFARNCKNPKQLKELTDRLRAITGRKDFPILIDQEGGRVQRLKAPHWTQFPPARDLGKISDLDLTKGIRAAWLQGRLIAEELREAGITINCAPICDVPTAGAHDVIGNRAFHNNPERVGILAKAYATGHIAGGILPVIKHIPGHGRAEADSHKDLPVVKASLAELLRHDFVPFKALNDLPLAMTAHIIYPEMDAGIPATQSEKIIQKIIREQIGFQGILISDAIEMNALTGTMHERAIRTFEAGCELPLYCNGPISESEKILASLPEITDALKEKWDIAQKLIKNAPKDKDQIYTYREEFDGLLKLLKTRDLGDTDPTAALETA